MIPELLLTNLRVDPLLQPPVSSELAEMNLLPQDYLSVTDDERRIEILERLASLILIDDSELASAITKIEAMNRHITVEEQLLLLQFGPESCGSPNLLSLLSGRQEIDLIEEIGDQQSGFTRNRLALTTILALLATTQLELKGKTVHHQGPDFMDDTVEFSLSLNPSVNVADRLLRVPKTVFPILRRRLDRGHNPKHVLQGQRSGLMHETLDVNWKREEGDQEAPPQPSQH